MKKNKFCVIVSFFFLGILINLAFVDAKDLQGYENQQFQLAKSYEASGNYEEAARIFKELYESNPNNELVFEAYFRTYEFLHKYSEMLPFTKNFAESNPSFKSYSKLATVYWKLGKTDKADETWNLLLKKFGNNIDVFQDLARDQIALRQYEKAIETLLKGRSYFKTSDLYAEYLSRYYPMIGDFEKGVDEIILLALSPNKSNYAKGRLYLYIENEDAQKVVLEKLKSAISKYPKNYALLDCYAWYMKLTKNYIEAFEAYKNIDKLKNSKGRDLYNFAYASQRDGEFETAQKVYNYILSNESMSPNHPNSLFGVTACMEQIILNKKQVTTEDIKSIIAQYDKVAKKYNNHSRAEEAKYNAAKMCYERLHDNKQAIKRLEELLKTSRNRNNKIKAQIALGEIFIIEKDMAKAKSFFHKVEVAKNVSEELINTASFNLALIEYFTGDLDTAQVMFNKIAKDVESEKANDAIEKSILIDQNKTDLKSMGYYRQADYALFLKEKDKAVKNYILAANSAMEPAFAQKALIDAIYIYKSKNDTAKVKQNWKRILDDYPEGIYTEKAYYEYAVLLQEQGKLDEAMDYYTKLLMEYPRSIYVPEARKKARTLRDKMKEEKKQG